MRTWLVAIRENLKLSQKIVAERAGITQPSYCNIEIGRRSPSVRSAKKIAAVLGFDWINFYK